MLAAHLPTSVPYALVLKLIPEVEFAQVVPIHATLAMELMHAPAA